jgi:hypothetical protein
MRSLAIQMDFRSGGTVAMAARFDFECPLWSRRRWPARAWIWRRVESSGLGAEVRRAAVVVVAVVVVVIGGERVLRDNLVTSLIEIEIMPRMMGVIFI